MTMSNPLITQLEGGLAVVGLWIKDLKNSASVRWLTFFFQKFF